MFGLADSTTYSFLDLSGSMFHPKTGPFIFTGNGVGRITIQPTTERTIHEYASDGTVQIAKVPDLGGKIIIQCQQVSTVNSWLSWAYMIISTFGEDKDWGRMVMLIRDIQHGTQYNIRGVSFTNSPIVNFEARGDVVNWILMYAAMMIFPPHPTGAGQLSAIAKSIFNI